MGRAQIGGREVRRYADLTSLYDAPPGLRPNQGHFFFLRPLPHIVTRRIALVITEPAPFTLEGPKKPISAKPGDTVKIPIACRRMKNFDGAVAIRLEGLPGKPPSDLPSIAKGADHAGIPLKICEAAAHGIPVVTTSLSGLQLGWNHERELLLADDPQSFTDACIRLYNDGSLWNQLRENMIKRVGEEFSPERFSQQLRSIIE